MSKLYNCLHFSRVCSPQTITNKFKVMKYGRRNTHTSADSKESAQFFGVGVLSGFAGSLVGLGGAFVALPFMTGHFNMAQNIAHGTSMAVVLATSFGATVAYAQRKSTSVTVDSTSSGDKIITDSPIGSSLFGNIPEVIGSVHVLNALCLALTSSITVVFGARLSKRIPARHLKLAHGCMMLVVGPLIPAQDYLREYIAAHKSAKKLEEDTSLANVATDSVASTNKSNGFSHLLRPMAIGVFSGTLAGIFGVGGGVIILPSLCFFTDMDYATSLGTSLCSMLPTAIIGSATQYLQGQLVVKAAVPLGVGCLAGAFIGGQCGTRVGDQNLKYGFATMMVIMGLRTIKQALKLIRK